ncbi:hypothetical protein TWF481_010368 [Arthrobotrys musiformis]|uniref:Uncharacterized protein n=1 Tax=Arthrobotrys musiformis TaxID=47236 RepID=A0AAV9W1Q1_9PEZI
MYFNRLIIALGAMSAVSATEVCVGVCNADNCLRALRATQIATRLPQASADCARIIDVTYTPPTVTKTEYETTTETTIVTIPSTLVKSFYDIKTDIISDTATTTVTITQAAANKRDVSSTSISFPSYATPCSGFYRFSSACSCIGVTPKIITVPTPSTTITIPTVKISSTSVIEIVEATTTITTATVSVTTTATTATNTATTTKTEQVPDVTGLGRVYINGAAANSYIGERIYRSASVASVMTDVNAAMQLRFDGNGRLWFASLVATADISLIGINWAQNVRFLDPNSLAATVRPLTCILDANSFLSCKVQDVPLTFAYTPGSTQYVFASDPDTATSGNVIQMKLS